MENRVPALDGERVFRARKRPKTIYETVNYKCSVTGQRRCITAQRLSFMVSTRHLYIGDTGISHLCHNALCIRVDHSSTEPQELMNERIKCASHDKCKSHGAYPFNCISCFEKVNSSLYTFV